MARFVWMVGVLLLAVGYATDAVGAIDNAASWNHDALDERASNALSQFRNHFSGEGVHVYVVDSGIDAHVEFENAIVYRATNENLNAVDEATGKELVWRMHRIGEPMPGECSTHGTTVASIIVGKTVGLAKRAIVHDVQVNCRSFPDVGDIIQALEWIGENAIMPAVVNISIEAQANESIDAAVRDLIDRGISVVVAAGNGRQDASNRSPARVAEAITVGAANPLFMPWGWDSYGDATNYGESVDLFAPGAAVAAASNTSYQSYISAEATSVAAPHVTAAVALYLESNPTASPAEVHEHIVSSATVGRMTGALNGSPNRFLYTYRGFLGDDVEGLFIGSRFAVDWQRETVYGWSEFSSLVSAYRMDGTIKWAAAVDSDVVATGSVKVADVAIDDDVGYVYVVAQAEGVCGEVSGVFVVSLSPDGLIADTLVFCTPPPFFDEINPRIATRSYDDDEDYIGVIATREVPGGFGGMSGAMIFRALHARDGELSLLHERLSTGQGQYYFTASDIVAASANHYVVCGKYLPDSGSGTTAAVHLLIPTNLNEPVVPTLYDDPTADDAFTSCVSLGAGSQYPEAVVAGLLYGRAVVLRTGSGAQNWTRYLNADSVEMLSVDRDGNVIAVTKGKQGRELRLLDLAGDTLAARNPYPSTPILGIFAHDGVVSYFARWPDPFSGSVYRWLTWYH